MATDSDPGRLPKRVITDRLEVRPPTELDRSRFVSLFLDHDFMVFSGEVHDRDSANARFDDMLVQADEHGFAKQPVIERSSGQIIGYVGVARFWFEGSSRLEFGYRLVLDARGRGYATEAGLALLGLAAHEYRGEILALIDPSNQPSANVIGKLGFAYLKRTLHEGDPCDVYRLVIPDAGSAAG